MKVYKVYREWVYKICFWLFAQLACLVAFCLSGDVMKVWNLGVEFEVRIKEAKAL